MAAGAIACASHEISLTRHATFDLALRHHGAEWLVTIEHRRTGQRRSFTGTSRGTGQTLVVTLADRASGNTSAREMFMRDLPEALAALLLGNTTLDDL